MTRKFFLENKRRKSKNSPGVTLVEVVVAIGILAMIFVVVFGAFGPYREVREMESSVLAIQSLLNKARSQTLSSQEDSAYGVHFESGRAVLFRGVVFSEPSSYNEEVTLSSRIRISLIDLENGVADVIFKRLTGEAEGTSGTVTVSLALDASKKKEVIVSPSGMVSQK